MPYFVVSLALALCVAVAALTQWLLDRQQFEAWQLHELRDQQRRERRRRLPAAPAAPGPPTLKLPSLQDLPPGLQLQSFGVAERWPADAGPEEIVRETLHAAGLAAQRARAQRWFPAWAAAQARVGHGPREEQA